MFSKICIVLITALIFPTFVFAKVYTVKNGDNLWEISKKFNVSVDEIKRVNNLRGNNLKVGMKLEIPEKRQKAGKNKNQNGNQDAIPQYHTVRKGENLFRIANKYGISVEELKRLNNLNNTKLSIGQKLIVKKGKSSIENFSVRPDERVPTISTEKIENKIKLSEIDELKASDELSKLSVSERILLFAKKMLHLPYRFGGNSFNGLDCSYFVKKVFSLVGVTLPRSAREQFTIGIPISKDELQPGDLVFFRTYARFPSHVGIYLGDNLFIHASTRAKKVTIDSLETPYYLKRYIGAKRILNLEKEEVNKAIEEVKKQES
jgi:cell wall-associated NlpC family hydrolase